MAILQSRGRVRKAHGPIPWRRCDEFCLRRQGLVPHQAFEVLGAVSGNGRSTTEETTTHFPIEIVTRQNGSVSISS